MVNRKKNKYKGSDPNLFAKGIVDAVLGKQDKPPAFTSNEEIIKAATQSGIVIEPNGTIRPPTEEERALLKKATTEGIILPTPEQTE